MSTISVSLPSDGSTADVADYNTPITTIVNAINGNLDNTNLASGAAISGSKIADNSIDLEAKASADTGWREVTDSWSYASATTITVPTDATTKYSVGDKIRLTQSTVKYFYIIGVTSTILTIIGGSDYTLTNAAISDISYSKAVSPVGFPQVFNYAPSTGGFASITTDIAQFTVTGSVCTVFRKVSGTSNTTTFTWNLPILPIATYGEVQHVTRCTDNSVTAYRSIHTSPGSLGAIMWASATSTTWSNANTKSIEGAEFSYRI